MTNPPVPPEISQYIVDYLHGDPETLKQCCLVSKSWVPCARKHVFGQMDFKNSTDLEAWKKAFPDPANSPAYYTRFLEIGCVELVTAADAEEGGWIRAFSNVVRLDVWNHESTYFLSQVFALVSPMPLLENLSLRGMVVDEDDNDGTVSQPSASPLLTGTLDLCLKSGIEHVVRPLLGLPTGIRLRELKCTLYSEEDICWVMALVKGCSDTLEHIDIDDEIREGSWTASIINLSEATKLKCVTFQTYNFVGWVTRALETISIDHRGLREVSVRTLLQLPPIRDISDFNLRETIGQEIYQRWVDLDRILVQLSESHAVRIKVAPYPSAGSRDLRMCMTELLTGTTKRDGTELHFDE